MTREQRWLHRELKRAGAEDKANDDHWRNVVGHPRPQYLERRYNARIRALWQIIAVVEKAQGKK